MNECQHTIVTGGDYQTIVLPLIFEYSVSGNTLTIVTAHGFQVTFQCISEDRAQREHVALNEAITHYWANVGVPI